MAPGATSMPVMKDGCLSVGPLLAISCVKIGQAWLHQGLKTIWGTRRTIRLVSFDPRHQSRTILEGRDRAPARAMLRAVGFTDEDLSRPLVGVAHSWIEYGPCNYNMRDLAVHIKEGIRQAGGTPIEINTVSISDGITMGTEAMKASLISREVITDSIELVGRGEGLDALVVIVGCDKTIPAGAMSLLRLNLPGLALYGGSIMPGHWCGRDLTIMEVFEAVGAHAAGKIDDEELRQIERHACPGAGACGGQYTANTMAMALEFLGLAPMGSGSIPAVDPRKPEVARQRHRRRRGVRRLDQRGAPPPCHRPRGRNRAEDRGFRPDQPRHPDPG